MMEKLVSSCRSVLFLGGTGLINDQGFGHWLDIDRTERCEKKKKITAEILEHVLVRGDFPVVHRY